MIVIDNFIFNKKTLNQRTHIIPIVILNNYRTQIKRNNKFKIHWIIQQYKFEFSALVHE